MPGQIHVSHPLEDKLVAIRMLEAGAKANVVCARFKISSSTLSTWKKGKQMYVMRELQGMNPTIKRFRTGKMHNVEVATVKWLRQARSSRENPDIDGKMIAAFATR